MTWWNKNSLIPTENQNFQIIIEEFVFKCPSCNEKKTKIGVNEAGKPRYKRQYTPVSARNRTFRRNGITGNSLTTVLAQIRRPLVKRGAYALLNGKESVENKVREITRNQKLEDPYFEIIVFQKKSGMTDPETFYYYIRNAFAHGSFEVKTNSKGEKVYCLECCNNGELKGRFRLKETSLISYTKFADMSVAEIKALQRKKK
ncbi:MAG: hypothetical protein ACI3VR_01375 [Intestinibacter sp.]|uniref:hypothetical protein n=1 Tax=Intestinibacter sp. TaxID=1965304 RepID=UPI003F18A7F3